MSAPAPGAGVGYQAASALNLIHQKPIDTVLISIDFTDFLVLSKRPVPDSYNGIPKLPNVAVEADGSQNNSYSWSYIKDHYQSLYSLDAFLSPMTLTEWLTLMELLILSELLTLVMLTAVSSTFC